MTCLYLPYGIPFGIHIEFSLYYNRIIHHTARNAKFGIGDVTVLLFDW